METLKMAPLAVLLIAAMALISCETPSPAETAACGSLSASASMEGLEETTALASSGASFTAFPAGVDLSSVSYSLTLTSSTSSASPISGGTSSTGSFSRIDMIPIGDWTATVTATASGATVGTASQTIAIAAETTTEARLDLAPPPGGTGTVAYSCSWTYAAVPTTIVTPINPSGSAESYTYPTAVTSISNNLSLPPGVYRFAVSLSVGGATQVSASQIVYVFAGCTTSLYFSADESTIKRGAPTTPTLDVETGYNATSGSYAYVSWTKATGATSYTLERAEAATAAALDSASFASIATGLSATVASYSDLGLTNTTFYRYRVTAANASGSIQAVADAPMSALTVASDVGGTFGTSRSYLLNTPGSLFIISPTTWTGWSVSSGTAMITNASLVSTTAILYSTNVTITAQ